MWPSKQDKQEYCVANLGAQFEWSRVASNPLATGLNLTSVAIRHLSLAAAIEQGPIGGGRFSGQLTFCSRFQASPRPPLPLS